MPLTMLSRLSILAHPLAFRLHVADLICPVFPFNWRHTVDYQIRIAGKSPITPSPIKLPFGSRHAHPRLGAMTPESQPRAELEILRFPEFHHELMERRRDKFETEKCQYVLQPPVSFLSYLRIPCYG